MNAENICEPVLAGLRSCLFTVHETMIVLYTAQWYYKKRCQQEQLLWCVEIVELLKLEGATHGNMEYNKPGWCSVIFQ